MKKDLQSDNRKVRIFVATADPRGIPFIVSVDRIKPVSGRCIEIGCCSCSRLLANIWTLPGIALLVCDDEHNLCFQLTGILLHMKCRPIVSENPSEFEDIATSHAEMTLVIRIDEIEEIEQAMHGDKTMSPAGCPVYLNRQVLRG